MDAPAQVEGMPPLPALRNIGDLADRRPVVVVDTREQTPLPIMRLATVRAGLLTGDYSIRGLEHLFAVERKSIPDLVSCCCNSNRERFENELHRLRGFRFRRLLVVGSVAEVEAGLYRSQIAPRAVLGSLAAFEIRYDIPVVWESDPTAAGRRVEGWAWYFARETVGMVNGLFRGSEPTAAA